MQQLGIIGGGAFGTALAITEASKGQEVWLWGRDDARMQAAEATRENAANLPGAAFPKTLRATGGLSQLDDVQTLLIALPTQAVRAFAEAHSPRLAGKTLIMCCKGVETSTGLLPTQIMQELVPGAALGVLTGPSFAADIGLRKPTALTLAVDDSVQHRTDLQEMLSTPTLRLYLTDDVKGAQLGGALKNVIAIAAGATIGAGLGESARAAIMTRGFAEIMRLAEAQGARAETLMGLSGFGDLILTCSSEKSRNYSYGQAVARGQTSLEGKTVEGVATALAVAAQPFAKEMPVTQAVAALVSGKSRLEEVMQDLLARPLRSELE